MPHIHFKGKNLVINHHLVAPYCQLKPIKAESVLAKGENVSLNDNLIVHGDNLLALKALLPTHAGKVNCIYIDPPYNTGNEKWCYNDNVANPMTKEWLGKVVDREDLTRHDKWLCMMYPRLMLLYELLAEDGAIFISIDDNEQHRLRMLMDEIFGEDNFVANIVWQKKYSPANDAKYFSDNHDFVLCYAKARANGEDNATTSWKRRLLPRTEKQDKRYKYDDKDGRGPWQSGDLSVKTYLPEYDYPIVNPKTKKKYNPPRGSCWRTSKENLQSWIDDGRIFFPPGGKSVPRLKRYLRDVQPGIVPLTVWTYDDVGHTDGARKDLKQIFTDQQLPFDNPKALKLLQRIFTIATDKDAIILDSFAGSGTTAQAVMQLNKEDGGNRKFVLVECEDYANTITAERVRRVIKGVKDAKNTDLKKGFGGGFSYWELGKPIEMKSILEGEALPKYEELAKYVFFTATGEEWNPDKMKKSKYYIGDSRLYEIYLYYEPKLDYLKETAFTLDMAETLPPAKKGKARMVFAPARYVNLDVLKDLCIEYCQLPFEIYSMTKSRTAKGK